MNHQKSANPSNAALYARTSTVSAYKLHTNCIWLSSCEATQTDAAYGGSKRYLRDGCNKSLPDPACGGSKWIEERYTAPVSLRPNSKNACFFHQRQARGGHGFAGAALPQFGATHDVRPVFFLWTHESVWAMCFLGTTMVGASLILGKKLEAIFRV